MNPDRARHSELRFAHFGMFIHWGIYSVPGGLWQGEETPHLGEWLQPYFRIPNAEYAKFAADFNPVHFDADAWVALAKAAGMKYLVFTAKHHDGFAMYHSRVNRFNIVDATPFKRDVLRELADACARHGLQLGIYYSHHLDWADPDGGDPGPDCPLNCNCMSWGNDWDFPDCEKKDFARYFHGKALPQLRELMTNYGPICELWCDCPLNIKPEYSRAIRDLVRELQPDCLINSRIGNGCGDFGSLGDNQALTAKLDKLVESPGTLNDTWGFKHRDHNWKKPEEVIEQLVSLTDKGANYLLNVGPMPDGRLTQETIAILNRVGEWYRRNGDGIFGSEANPFPQNLGWAYCTQKDHTLNFFLRRPATSIRLAGLEAAPVAADCPVEIGDGGTLTLFPDPARQSGFLPLLRLNFAAPPRIRPELRLQNDELALAPARGTLIHGRPDTGDAVTQPEKLDVAGMTIDQGEHSVLTGAGLLACWHHPHDAIEWDLELEPGTYECRILTQKADHSRTWNSSRIVEVTLGDAVCRTPLADDELPHSPYFPQVLSRAGQFTFAAPFRGKLRLRTLAVGDEGARLMSLGGVTLRKLS